MRIGLLNYNVWIERQPVMLTPEHLSHETVLKASIKENIQRIIITKKYTSVPKKVNNNPFY